MSSPKQQPVSFDAISQLIWAHLEERDWLGGSPRSIATSLVLEAGELLEHYQWSDTPVGNKQELGEELADVLIYAFQYAQQNDIDMVAAIQDKLAKAAAKYPAEQFKGKSSDAKRSAWLEAKRNHHKEGL